LSADNKQVNFIKSGLYQIHVRLGGTNSGNTQHLGLQVNGVDVAQCLQSDGNSYQNTAQITEILQILERDVVQVRCGCNNNSIAVALQTRLSILML